MSHKMSFSFINISALKTLTLFFALGFITFMLLYVTYPPAKEDIHLLPPVRYTSIENDVKLSKVPREKVAVKYQPIVTPTTTKKITKKTTKKKTTDAKTTVPIPQNVSKTCPSVVDGMTLGHWDAPKLTKEQFHEVWKEIKRATNRMPIYHNLQRPDLKCQNATFKPMADYVRALCDPEGTTPCCEDNMCTNKTIRECRCKGCVDLRHNVIHPKYAKWIPSDRRCQLTNFTKAEACDMFKGWTIHFVGDSLVQQMSTGMIITLKGDPKVGALDPKSPPDVLKRCVYSPQFDNGGICKRHVIDNGTFCDGSVKFVMNRIDSYKSVGKFKELILRLQNKPKTLVFIQVGIHHHFNPNTTVDLFLKKSLDKLKKDGSKWPLIIFGTTPAPGPLKSPIHVHQTWDKVLYHNNAVTRILKAQYNVTTLDFFPMSQNLMPYDGTHYGMGYTLNRVYLLLHYIKEWTSKNK